MTTHYRIRTAQVLFLLNAAIWLDIGIISMVRAATRHPEQVVTVWVIAILMFGNVGAMALSAWGLAKHRKLFYSFALFVLAVNILLTFTDQFGIIDLLTLGLDLILFGLLITVRHEYLYHSN